MPDFPMWAAARIKAAVWTALPPKFEGSDAAPSSDQVVNYLRSLRGPTAVSAQQYIERTPAQIDTDYRREIEAALGWRRCD